MKNAVLGASNGRQAITVGWQRTGMRFGYMR